jgi:hypothetical protein
VLRGEADEDLLDTYQEERLPIAEWTLSISGGRPRTMVNDFTGGRNGYVGVIAPPEDVAAVPVHPGWRRLDPRRARSIRSEV